MSITIYNDRNQTRMSKTLRIFFEFLKLVATFALGAGGTYTLMN